MEFERIQKLQAWVCPAIGLLLDPDPACAQVNMAEWACGEGRALIYQDINLVVIMPNIKDKRYTCTHHTHVNCQRLARSERSLEQHFLCLKQGVEHKPEVVKCCSQQVNMKDTHPELPTLGQSGGQGPKGCGRRLAVVVVGTCSRKI